MKREKQQSTAVVVGLVVTDDEAETKKRLDVGAVRRSLGRVLQCSVVSARPASATAVVCELPDVATASRALTADNKLSEVLGCAVTVDQFHERKSRRAIVAAALAEEEAADAERANRHKTRGKFVPLLDDEDEEKLKKLKETTVVEKNTVCALRCPVTLGNETALRTLFGQAGTVCNVVMRHDITGTFTGTAFVEFDDEQSAQTAISTLHNRLIDGSRISVRPYIDPVAGYEHPKPKKQPKLA